MVSDLRARIDGSVAHRADGEADRLRAAVHFRPNSQAVHRDMRDWVDGGGYGAWKEQCGIRRLGREYHRVDGGNAAQSHPAEWKQGTKLSFKAYAPKSD